jgi:DNA-binding response OmpR family regulator
MQIAGSCFERMHFDFLETVGAGCNKRLSYGDVFLHLPNQFLYSVVDWERLSPMEYQIIWLLVRAQGGCVTYDEMVYFIYDERMKDIPLANTIQVFICRLRKKLSSISQMVVIETFRSYGYNLSSK